MKRDKSVTPNPWGATLAPHESASARVALTPEYPRWVRKAGEPDWLVQTAEEFAALIASNGEGWE